jgi:hypothetical protein
MAVTIRCSPQQPPSNWCGMKRELNEYLLHEFGFYTEEQSERPVSEDWLFALELALSFEHAGVLHRVFSFGYEGEAYYAVSANYLDFFPLAGVDTEALKCQLIGPSWIGSRNPVNLDTIRIGDPAIPALADRRRRFRELAERLQSGVSAEILEGLFLLATNEHLGLVQFAGEAMSHIVGDSITFRNIPYPRAGAWRRLSIGIGRLVLAGKLRH